MSEANWDYEKAIRPADCVCIVFRDAGGFRIADLACPVHGVDGSEPGDGFWALGDTKQWMD